ncbi:MAG: AMP-binding protein [Bacteroidales bacterium]|nr:AMP-binding protein [Bacteroidales bacterium]
MVKEIKTIQELLHNSFVSFSEQPALGFVDQKMFTYGELSLLIERQVFRFAKLGIKPGDKVAIVGTSSPNWVIAYFSILCHGAIAVPVLPDFTAEEIENVLIHSESRMVFVSSKLYKRITQAVRQNMDAMILLDNMGEIPNDTSNDDLSKVEEYRGDGRMDACLNEVKPDDLASIIYTSGTTGSSKGVMLSHLNLATNIRQCASIEPLGVGEVFLSILPLSHSLENTVGLLLPIAFGARIFYLEKPPTASVLVPALRKVQPTYFLSVPMVIEKIYKLQIKAKFVRSPVLRRFYRIPVIRKTLHRIAGKQLLKTFGGRLKFFGIGGAKLDASTERFLSEAKFPYAIGYGLTETAPFLAGDGVKLTRFQSTGRPVHSVEMKIHDPDPITGEGEVWVRGENIMKGYYKEPELTRQVLSEDGWFRTGDLGIMNSERYLYIKGRLKNVIVGSSGENIYPEEIESVINRFSHVLESVVVEREGKLIALVYFNMDEIEKQFHHLKAEAKRQAETKALELVKDLRGFVNQRVNKFSQIQIVVSQLQPFEKTATKKIKRYLYK